MEKYYVKVSFEYGKVSGNGLDPKNTGEMFWTDMEFGEAVALENAAVVPGLNSIATEAANLGLIQIGGLDLGKK